MSNVKMSNVKMCNRHKGFFMYGEEGSCKLKVKVTWTYDSGESYIQHETWDFCVRCTTEMRIKVLVLPVPWRKAPDE